MKIPQIDKIENKNNKPQSNIKLLFPKSPTKPNNDLIAIIINDVATRIFD